MKEFIFIHIPKTSGRKLISLFPKETSNYQSSPHRFKNSGGNYLGHVSIKSMIDSGYITKEFLKKAFVFCFIRNPYNRVVSLFNHVGKEEGFTDFKTFLENLPNIPPIGLYNRKGLSMCNPQVEWIKGKIDFIGKFENLEKDYLTICNKIEIEPKPFKLINKNYSTYYTPYTNKLIEEYYSEDFKLWNL